MRCAAGWSRSKACFIGASSQLGSFESGTAAQLLGPVAAVWLGGFATILIVVLWATVFPALRTSDRLAGAVAEEESTAP